MNATKTQNDPAAEVQLAAVPVARLLSGWFASMDDEHRAEVASLREAGLSFGALIVLGADGEPSAAIVGVDAHGLIRRFATLDRVPSAQH